MAKILVIDDLAACAEVIREILQELGHEAQMATTGREGLDCFQSGAFDLVITDIFMPDTDGFEVIEKIKEQDKDVKILAMSGGSGVPKYDNLDYLGIAQMVGADQAVSKPFNVDELREIIGQLLPAEQAQK